MRLPTMNSQIFAQVVTDVQVLQEQGLNRGNFRYLVSPICVVMSGAPAGRTSEVGQAVIAIPFPQQRESFRPAGRLIRELGRLPRMSLAGISLDLIFSGIHGRF